MEVDDDDALEFLIILVKYALNYSMIFQKHLAKTNNKQSLTVATLYHIPKQQHSIQIPFIQKRPVGLHVIPVSRVWTALNLMQTIVQIQDMSFHVIGCGFMQAAEVWTEQTFVVSLEAWLICRTF